MTATERLVAAIRAAPYSLAQAACLRRAEAFAYHDFRSASATPKVDCVRDLIAAGLDTLAGQVMAGVFDESAEEADAWFQREGRALLEDPHG